MSENSENEKIRVLLVEDFKSDAELAEYEIRQVIPDAEFKLVDNRKNFVEALDKFDPHVIVSDYNMPGFDGMTALKLTLEKKKITPFILFTGSINEDTAVECMKLGANHYIIKEHIKRLGQSVKNAYEQRNVILEKKFTDEKARQYTIDQKILLDTASQFLAASNLNKIYEIAFESIKPLTGDSYIVLTSINPEEGIGRIIHHHGFQKYINFIRMLLNYDPMLITVSVLDMTEQDKLSYMSGKLLKHPEGLFSLTSGKIPKNACSLIEKTLKFKECYYIGFSSSEFMYGGLTILKRDTGIPERAQVIELIMQQASQAIQRYYALQLAIQNKERLQSLLDISQYKTSSSQELLDLALNEIVKLTKSKIGFIYHYYEDTCKLVLNTWSKNVMKECNIQNPETTYQLDKTGIWGEAVRQRKPIIVNNYEDINPLKKGYPEGHVELKKFLTIPVFYGDQIVAVAGVGNKETDYNQTDVNQLTLMMDSVWKLVKQKELDFIIIENEEKYKAVINQSANNIYLADLETLKIIEANPAICNYLGYTNEEMLELRISDLIAYSNITLSDLMEQLRTKKRMHIGERSYKKKNREVVIVDANASILNYRNKQVICVISQDVTERKKSELALYQSKEKLKMILNSSPIATASVNEDGIITGSNDSFKETFNLIEQPINFNVFNKDFISDEEKTLLLSGEILKIEKTFTFNQLEEIFKTRINRTGKIDLEITTKAYEVDPEIHQFEFLIQMQDITERKKIENLKNEFVNTVSHEMRTPLTSIKESIVILKEHYNDNLIDEQKSLLDVSLRNINRLGNLIQDVLDVQKLDALMEFNKRPESINSLIQEVIKDIGIISLKPDLEIVLKLDENLPLVFIDKARISQVLINIIDNAVKFTQKGSITIKTECKSGEKRVKISVTDTGIGIEKQYLGKIFTPFFQIRNDDNRSIKGTGLGLSICKKILNGHESDLIVLSEIKKGTTFYFYLPLAE